MEVIRKNMVQSYSSSFEVAKAYYHTVLLLNGINISNGELNLLAFSAIHGTFSTPPVKNAFMQAFNVKRSRVGNLLRSLRMKGVMEYDEKRKIRISKVLRVDFSKPVLLQIGMKNNGDERSDK